MLRRHPPSVVGKAVVDPSWCLADRQQPVVSSRRRGHFAKRRLGGLPQALQIVERARLRAHDVQHDSARSTSTHSLRSRPSTPSTRTSCCFAVSNTLSTMALDVAARRAAHRHHVVRDLREGGNLQHHGIDAFAVVYRGEHQILQLSGARHSLPPSSYCFYYLPTFVHRHLSDRFVYSRVATIGPYSACGQCVASRTVQTVCFDVGPDRSRQPGARIVAGSDGAAHAACGNVAHLGVQIIDASALMLREVGYVRGANETVRRRRARGVARAVEYQQIAQRREFLGAMPRRDRRQGIGADEPHHGRIASQRLPACLPCRRGLGGRSRDRSAPIQARHAPRSPASASGVRRSPQVPDDAKVGPAGSKATLPTPSASRPA